MKKKTKEEFLSIIRHLKRGKGKGIWKYTSDVEPHWSITWNSMDKTLQLFHKREVQTYSITDYLNR